MIKKLIIIIFNIKNNNIICKPCNDINGNINNIEIIYEPSILGVSNGYLNITNKEGGNYYAYLIGKSTLPLPKGPYIINNKGYNIEFKNPFYYNKEFIIKTDNNNFVVNG